MAEARSVTPEETAALLEEGYVYVDVRSEREFEAGHVPGALNVPISRQGQPNPEFLAVMQGAFGVDEKVVLGCQSGGRSRRAAEQLSAAGFRELVQMPAGMDGTRDAFGRAVPGWVKLGMPVETGAPAGQAYTDVKQRKPAST